MRTSILIICILLSLFLISCRRSAQEVEEAPDVSISLAVQPQSPAVGPTLLIITLTNAGGDPINGAVIEIRGDMSHAGMKPVLANATLSQTGVYEAPFEWTMAGDWIVTVTATLPDGRTVTREFDLTIAGAMEMEP